MPFFNPYNSSLSFPQGTGKRSVISARPCFLNKSIIMQCFPARPQIHTQTPNPNHKSTPVPSLGDTAYRLPNAGTDTSNSIFSSFHAVEYFNDHEKVRSKLFNNDKNLSSDSHQWDSGRRRNSPAFCARIQERWAGAWASVDFAEYAAEQANSGSNQLGVQRKHGRRILRAEPQGTWRFREGMKV